ncbi:MAG: GspH/FimT family protein [Verrucomicrobia bacterium]|nr:GspH/FimT family protein [Verrucomicrobiota bacterium]
MTIFIMSIVGSVTVVSSRNILTRMRMDRASSRLAFQLQQARSEAIANNQTIFVALDTAENLLEVWVDRNRDGKRDADELTRVRLEAPGNVSIESDWTTGAFNAYGQFITTPGQREMKTVRTRMRVPGVDREVELTLRGSGAVTKR